jgi:riboflavin kinase/FMN adenylyltransferase
VPLKVFSPHEVDEQRVSSTLIKNLLLEADLLAVERFLGRKFCVYGEIVKGHNRGEGIGFPTANIDLPVPLKNGVYATIIKFENKSFKAITNVGLRPTVNDNMDLWNKNIETHIPGEKLSLYGKNVQVEFQTFIRDEKKFSSLEDLKAQISLDLKVLDKMTMV